MKQKLMLDSKDQHHNQQFELNSEEKRALGLPQGPQQNYNQLMAMVNSQLMYHQPQNITGFEPMEGMQILKSEYPYMELNNPDNLNIEHKNEPIPYPSQLFDQKQEQFDPRLFARNMMFDHNIIGLQNDQFIDQNQLNSYQFGFNSHKNDKKQIPLKKVDKITPKVGSNDINKRQYIRKNGEKVKRWTRDEALLYEKFVELNYDTMKDSTLKRNTKIFMLMSRFIGNKSPSQCRSHHQKFYKKFIQKMELKKLNNLHMHKYGNIIQQMKYKDNGDEKSNKSVQKMNSIDKNNCQNMLAQKRLNQKKKIAEKKMIMNQKSILGAKSEDKEEVKNEEILNQWMNMPNIQDIGQILNSFSNYQQMNFNMNYFNNQQQPYEMGMFNPMMNVLNNQLNNSIGQGMIGHPNNQGMAMFNNQEQNDEVNDDQQMKAQNIGFQNIINGQSSAFRKPQ